LEKKGKIGALLWGGKKKRTHRGKEIKFTGGEKAKKISERQSARKGRTPSYQKKKETEKRDKTTKGN